MMFIFAPTVKVSYSQYAFYLKVYTCTVDKTNLSPASQNWTKLLVGQPVWSLDNREDIWKLPGYSLASLLSLLPLGRKLLSRKKFWYQGVEVKKKAHDVWWGFRMKYCRMKYNCHVEGNWKGFLTILIFFWLNFERECCYNLLAR